MDADIYSTRKKMEKIVIDSRQNPFYNASV